MPLAGSSAIVVEKALRCRFGGDAPLRNAGCSGARHMLRSRGCFRRIPTPPELRRRARGCPWRAGGSAGLPGEKHLARAGGARSGGEAMLPGAIQHCRAPTNGVQGAQRPGGVGVWGRGNALPPARGGPMTRKRASKNRRLYQAGRNGCVRSVRDKRPRSFR